MPVSGKNPVKTRNLTQKQIEALELLREKKKKLKELKEKQEKLALDGTRAEQRLLTFQEKNKILFFGHEGMGHLGKKGKWEPNPLQKKVFNAIENPAKRIVLMSGANQIGKTLAETCIAMALLRGHWPWEDPREVGFHIWESRGWKPPIYIRWIGQAWEGHIQKVLIEKGLQELWPSSWHFNTKKNNLGVIHLWKDMDTKNELQIMSTNQAVKEFEGWTGHGVLFDEPAPRDVWIACQRGLIANRGLAMMGATLLGEGWITTDIINKVDDKGFMDKSVSYFTSDIRTNLGFGLDEEGIQAFESQLTDAERDARIKGIPSFMSTLVLHIDKEKNIVPRFELPTHWMVDIAIDIGLAKAHDITYIATDEMGMKYIIFEDVIRGDGVIIGDSIIRKKNRYNLRVNRVICDPYAKSDKNNENSQWEKIHNTISRHGMLLEEGSKDKEDGVIAINNHLMTVNNMPALFFFDDCHRAIKQCMNWVRDPDTQKPSKKDDDQCENIYRLMLLDTEWEEPYNPELDSEYTDKRRNIDDISGY
jgi:hypothetical protein